MTDLTPEELAYYAQENKGERLDDYFARVPPGGRRIKYDGEPLPPIVVG